FEEAEAGAAGLGEVRDLRSVIEVDQPAQCLPPGPERRGPLRLDGWTPERAYAHPGSGLRQLLGQARLADPRLAAHQHRTSLSRPSSREHLIQLFELVPPADK